MQCRLGAGGKALHVRARTIYAARRRHIGAVGMIRASIAFVLLVALCACADENGKDRTRTDGSPANSGDEVRDATPEELAELDGMLAQLATGRPDLRSASDLANLIGARRHSGASMLFDSEGVAYRIVDGAVEETIPPDAAARGIKALAGVEFAGDGPVFKTVIASYMIFDDPDAAEAYHRDLDSNLGALQLSEWTQFSVEWNDYPQIVLRCVYVPDTHNSLNCHYMTADQRIVVVLLLGEGPQVAFSGQEPAVNQVLAAGDARLRAGLAGAASWAYLYDAVYR